jgi:hypothetical protein
LKGKQFRFRCRHQELRILPRKKTKELRICHQEHGSSSSPPRLTPGSFVLVVVFILMESFYQENGLMLKGLPRNETKRKKRTRSTSDGDTSKKKNRIKKQSRRKFAKNAFAQTRKRETPTLRKTHIAKEMHCSCDTFFSGGVSWYVKWGTGGTRVVGTYLVGTYYLGRYQTIGFGFW